MMASQGSHHKYSLTVLFVMGQPRQPSQVLTNSVVYDGQSGQPSQVLTNSVVYDGQSGQPSQVLTNSVVCNGPARAAITSAH